MEVPRNTLSKEERLCGKNAISSLLAKGRFVKAGNLSFCYAANEAGINRIMISVPKKTFKRAVKRNLLKRRIRESYRRQKQLLTVSGTDILFMYKANDILSYEQIYTEIGKVMERINENR